VQRDLDLGALAFPARLTGVSFKTSISPARSKSGSSRTILCSRDPSSLTTSNRAASRGAMGRSAIKSEGRSKSNSSTRINRRF